jgi:hypothetical protein
LRRAAVARFSVEQDRLNGVFQGHRVTFVTFRMRVSGIVQV